MRHAVAGMLVLGAALAAAPAAQAGPPAPLDERALAARLDERVAAHLKARKAQAAPQADDAEFVRRVYLDLSGRVPDILEARDFMDNPAKDKREKLIAKLLDGPRYPLHFANVWRAILIPDGSDMQTFFFRPAIETWLRNELKNNTGYDSLARALVTGGVGRGDAGSVFVFYQANGLQPESLAAVTSRLFLGVKLECAQCHNHPFAKWTRKQFWEYAAFFAGATPVNVRFGGGFRPPAAAVKLREIKIPGTDKIVKARFLDGKEPKWSDGVDPRVALADWMTAPDNPYFARAAVNRMWEYFLGTGLVDPVDEASPDNLPSHPELLEELAGQFAAHKFDLKYLIKALVLSQAYQRTSRATHPGQADARLFARVRVRGLSPEQLYDSLAVATGQPEEDVNSAYADARFGRVNASRMEFLRRFPNQDKRTEQHTSILQALYLMNGSLVADATSLGKNKNLAIIAEAKTVRTARRVEQLYLIALSRKPRPEESARLVKYVDKGGPSGDTALALCDVFWALLNSSEFCVNH